MRLYEKNVISLICGKDTHFFPNKTNSAARKKRVPHAGIHKYNGRAKYFRRIKAFLAVMECRLVFRTGAQEQQEGLGRMVRSMLLWAGVIVPHQAIYRTRSLCISLAKSRPFPVFKRFGGCGAAPAAVCISDRSTGATGGFAENGAVNSVTMLINRSRADVAAP